MISEILGLSISQKVLNKKSSSSVVSTLQKTATNYIAIGRMAEDLKLIRLNFSRWLAIEGVRVRGTPDAHMLKEDELGKKFSVLREKFVKSKVSKDSQDGTNKNKGWAKNLLEKYINYKIERRIERKITASILKKYKNLTVIRKLVRLHKKVLKVINKLLPKINIKKMFKDWFKKNSQKLIKPITTMFSNVLKRFLSGASTKLLSRVGISVMATIWSGPFVPIVASVVFLGLMLWDPIKDAWEAFTKGEDFVNVFIVGVLDEFSFGLFGKENIKEWKTMFVEWYEGLFMKMFDAIDKSIKWIEQKFTDFADFIIKKIDSMFTMESRPEDFVSSFEEYNNKRLEEDAKNREKYAEYFKQMDEKIKKKKLNIRLLEIDIFNLEDDLKNLNQSPESQRLGEAKEEVAALKGEQVAAAAPPPKEQPKPTPTPAPPPKKEEKKPEVAAMRSEQVSAAAPASKTSGKFEYAKQMVIAYEGWKNTPYKDTKGLWTIGVGHLIGKGTKLPIIDPKFPELGTITEKTVLTNDQVRMIFEKDFEEHLKLAEKAPGWNKANESGKTGLIDLAYNMGGWWYNEHPKTARFMAEGNFKEAARELETSLWYKQVKDRAPLTVKLIRAGAANDKEGESALAAVMSSQKVASAGKYVGQESTQVAQAQREQMKPKDVDKVNVAQTNNNKKVQQENVASYKPKQDNGSSMSQRAAA
jgi:GH24 family phage-related lysozyme (muramidase)